MLQNNNNNKEKFRQCNYCIARNWMLVSLRRERVKEVEEMSSVKFTEHQHLGMRNSDFNALLELSPNNIKSQCTIPNAQSNLHCISYNNIYYILLSFSAFVTFVKLSVNLLQSLRSNLQRWNLNIYSKNIYSHCYSKKLGDWSRNNNEQETVRNNWCLLSINASLCNTFIAKILRKIESTGTVSIGGTMFF